MAFTAWKHEKETDTKTDKCSCEIFRGLRDCTQKISFLRAYLLTILKALVCNVMPTMKYSILSDIQVRKILCLLFLGKIIMHKNNATNHR